MTTISHTSCPVPTWTKSSYSGGNNNCLEVAHGLEDALPIRDSKRPTGPVLTIPGAAWTAFVTSVKSDELR
ncbi:DUF397 domain-containing protein [Streptomyces sp. NBC_01511]|uniref:DUF397 domain-containing protein n=1 Tax=unclassified Streptomyces TaxID=2593676 RepID=UPI00386A5FAE